ncbi:MAG: HAD hydrolase family protein [Acidovorax sp.]|uniref:HAD family hydrolase n=1 Tax=Acidovorax sp. TaxID=1872122 RepID=UPI00261D4966|nr:HAD hydrolase family protein [Acidovorax sp.]MDH4427724.1 HAD hydrolase family protein [Acidovorax sp.]
MTPLAQWPVAWRRAIRGVFTDIDDTLTHDGCIAPEALKALGDLKAAGLTVIPITGRPVGWCEPFLAGADSAAWPVDAIVAENGAVALVPAKASSISAGHPGCGPRPPGVRAPPSKRYQQAAATRAANRLRMDAIAAQVCAEVPGMERSADSAGRETDLALDHAEFARHSPETVQRVLALLQNHGMQTTVSSIHIHGCFGDFNKWTGACWILRELTGRDLTTELDHWVFVGDSGNDQPMFQHFTHSVGVANIARFAPQLTHLPRYVARGERGAGFAEVARAVLQGR